MTLVCRRWPSIAPHGPEVPNSIWNLPYGVWLGIAASADQYLEEVRRRNQEQQRGRQ